MSRPTTPQTPIGKKTRLSKKVLFQKFHDNFINPEEEQDLHELINEQWEQWEHGNRETVDAALLRAHRKQEEEFVGKAQEIAMAAKFREELERGKDLAEIHEKTSGILKQEISEEFQKISVEGLLEILDEYISKAEILEFPLPEIIDTAEITAAKGRIENLNRNLSDLCTDSAKEENFDYKEEIAEEIEGVLKSITKEEEKIKNITLQKAKESIVEKFKSLQLQNINIIRSVFPQKENQEFQAELNKYLQRMKYYYNSFLEDEEISDPHTLSELFYLASKNFIYRSMLIANPSHTVTHKIKQAYINLAVNFLTFLEENKSEYRFTEDAPKPSTPPTHLGPESLATLKPTLQPAIPPTPPIATRPPLPPANVIHDNPVPNPFFMPNPKNLSRRDSLAPLNTATPSPAIPKGEPSPLGRHYSISDFRLRRPNSLNPLPSSSQAPVSGPSGRPLPPNF